MSARFGARGMVALFAALVSTAAFAGCGVDDGLVGGRCAAGYTQCGLRCVELSSDPENCGACGQVCLAGLTCTAGMCGSPSDGSPGSSPEGSATDSPAEGAATGTDAPTNEDSPSVTGESGTDTGAGDAGPDDDGAGNDGSREADPGEASTSDSATGDAGDGGTTVGPGDPLGGNDAAGDDGSSLPDAGVEDAADGATADADTSDSGSADASDDAVAEASSDDAADAGEAASPCMPPLVSCGGTCIDVTSDPTNCGGCNIVCASQLCDNSRCVGAASGGVVYIGHDYTSTPPGTAQARVLSNAVFIPGSNPLHVMAYERYAMPSSISHVDAILNSVATQLGRTLSIRSVTTDDDVRDQLSLPNYDVLLVHDQSSAPDMALASLGSNWSQTLSNFTLGGGVVVILDGGTGIGQMPAFATATGLLQVMSHTGMATWTPLTVSSRIDVVGIGVISPYAGEQSSVSVSTEANGGNVVYVVELETDSGAGAPVVVHKAF